MRYFRINASFLFFQETRFDNPVTVFSESLLEQMKLRYYNAEVHRTAFVLPQFAKKVMGKLLNLVWIDLSLVHVHSQHLEYQGWFESRGDSNLTFPWVIENLRNDYDNGDAAKTKYIEQNTPSALAAKQQRKVTKFKIFVESVHQHKGGIQSLFSFLILNTTPPILPGAVRSVCSSSTS